MSSVAAAALDWVERGLVPDPVIRGTIRRLCAHRLQEIEVGDCKASARALGDVQMLLARGPA